MGTLNWDVKGLITKTDPLGKRLLKWVHSLKTFRFVKRSSFCLFSAPFFSSITYEASILDHVELPDTEQPVFVLGQCYSALYGEYAIHTYLYIDIHIYINMAICALHMIITNHCSSQLIRKLTNPLHSPSLKERHQLNNIWPIVSTVLSMFIPSKNETSIQCWANVGTQYTTLAQHRSNIRSMSRV